jgi:hypothetical protein
MQFVFHPEAVVGKTTQIEIKQLCIWGENKTHKIQKHSSRKIENTIYKRRKQTKNELLKT